MIYAALLEDRETFDAVWAWTRENLSRRDKTGDRLFARHWKDGAVADWNAASDAGLDICTGLLLAAQAWKDEALRDAAAGIAADILELETAPTPAGRVLLPGTWGREDGAWVLNPSYASPAACRLIAEATGREVWTDLAENSYELWTAVGRRLGRSIGVGLPPDWCLLREDGGYDFAPRRSAAYGWEALRVPLRAGFDAVRFERDDARRYLRLNLLPVFTYSLAEHAPAPAAITTYWGAPADPTESLAMTAAVLFAYQAAGEPPPPSLRETFVRQRVAPRFARAYYAQSMAFWPLAHDAGLLSEP
jgi:endo-1,4-beta-D-glucanase Y